MSLLLRQVRAVPKAFASRAISTTSLRMGSSACHDNDPKILGKGKAEVLREQTKHTKEQPKWHEELASESEAFVKASRGEIEASNETIKTLQEKTKTFASKKHNKP